MKDSFFSQILPVENSHTRNQLFRGEVFLLPPNKTSSRLTEEIISVMEDRLETKDIRHAHLNWSDQELFERIGDLRRTFYLEPHFQAAVPAMAEECGFDPESIRFDPIRIRVVLPGGHHNPLAAPVYFPHRDTWYAHPQSLIVWWIPLHDLRPEETFEFFPESFEREVSNDSEVFDYSQWVKDGPALKIGWQDPDSGVEARYPRALQQPDSASGVGFSCRAGEQLIFAGSHYHKTLEQDFDTIRFSLDFRIVDLKDVKEGKGAPNVDNRSRGSTLKDYVTPSGLPVFAS